MAQTISTAVSNETAVVRVQNPSGATKGILMDMSDTVTVPDTANNDTVILGTLPVNCILKHLEVDVGDLGSAGTLDIGLYKRTTVDDVIVYTAVLATAIASGLSATPSFSETVVPTRFAGLAADAVNARLWEIAGLSAKPEYPSLYIGIKTTTGTTTSGTASVSAIFKE